MHLALALGFRWRTIGRELDIGSDEKTMRLSLQFGYGMMDHCRTLLKAWGGGTVILSPRDLSGKQLLQISKDIRALPGSRVLVDPQFYLPRADHARLLSHGYWPADYDSGHFLSGNGLRTMLGKLKELNEAASTVACILPGKLAQRVDADWLDFHDAVLEEARDIFGETPLVSTLALSADALRNEAEVAEIVERAARWKQRSYYIVCEHPGGGYLVDDPIWLASVLDLAASLRVQGSNVTLGYCNHQMLVAACAGVNTVASGTWMNVRSFPPDKFNEQYEDEIKQRSKWYYCPHALSEYKLPFLDIAQRQGVLTAMTPQPPIDSKYCAQLFSGPQPSTVGWTEQAAFRHYLESLRIQVGSSTGASYDETMTAHQRLLDTAADACSTLWRAGVRGQGRDFAEIVDVNRAALGLFNATHGARLRRVWDSLTQSDL